MAGGRHRPHRSGAKAAGVAALVVVTLGGLGYAGARWGYPAISGAKCGSGALVLHVSAAPDIAPALATAAQMWNATKPHTGGQCVRAEVTAVASGDVFNALTAPADGAASPSAAPTANVPATTDVWVPESTNWIERVKTVDSTIFSDVGPAIASSPVVVAVPKAAAKIVGLTEGAISPKALIGMVRDMRNSDLIASATNPPTKFQLGMADPATDAAAVAGASLITGLDHAAQGDMPENAALVADFRFISPVGQQSATTKDLLGSFVSKVDGVPPMTAAIVSEQAAIAHNDADSTNPLNAVYIQGFKLGLDYPIATLARRPAGVSDAATAFAQAMAAPAQRDVLAKAGFRAPDGSAPVGFPAADGISSDPVKSEPMRYDDLIRNSMKLWAGATEEARVLTMVNLASSMGTASGYQTDSRMQLTAEAANRGLRMFTPGSGLGVWGFAPGIGKNDYKEVVPIDLLGKIRPQVAAAFNAATPLPSTGCALYPALASAYQMMRDGYSSGEINTIVVFTDCATAPPGDTMSKASLESTLSNMVDPAHSIGVILINVGPTSNEASLSDIAKTVNGAAVTLQDPAQIVQVFMRSLVVLS